MFAYGRLQSALFGEPPDLSEFERIDLVVDEEIGK